MQKRLFYWFNISLELRNVTIFLRDLKDVLIVINYKCFCRQLLTGDWQ